MSSMEIEIPTMSPGGIAAGLFIAAMFLVMGLLLISLDEGDGPSCRRDRRLLLSLDASLAVFATVLVAFGQYGFVILYVPVLAVFLAVVYGGHGEGKGTGNDDDDKNDENDRGYEEI